MKVLLKTNETLEQAASRHKQFTEDEQGWMAAQARSMFLHDHASRLGEARRAGLAEGEQKGKMEEAMETAKRLIAEGMDTDFIVRVTHLPAKEVENLR